MIDHEGCAARSEDVAVKRTDWSRESRTTFKATALQRILSLQKPSLLVEGATGPGRYLEGESPFLRLAGSAREAVCGGGHAFLILVEGSIIKRSDLIQELGSRRPDAVMVCSKVDSAWPWMLLASKKGWSLASCLEPMGGQPLPLERVAQFASLPRSLVFVILEAGFENRFSFIDQERKVLNDLIFFSPEWRLAKDLPGDQRAGYLIELYKNRLSSVFKGSIRSYDVREEGGDAFHLITCCEDLDSIAASKGTLWGMSSDWIIQDHTKSLSPINVTPDGPWMLDASRLVLQRFRGRSIPYQELRGFVMQETPYPFTPEILRLMESKGMLESVRPRSKKFEYPDRCTIRFTIQ